MTLLTWPVEKEPKQLYTGEKQEQLLVLFETFEKPAKSEKNGTNPQSRQNTEMPVGSRQAGCLLAN